MLNAIDPIVESSIRTEIWKAFVDSFSTLCHKPPVCPTSRNPDRWKVDYGVTLGRPRLERSRRTISGITEGPAVGPPNGRKIWKALVALFASFDPLDEEESAPLRSRISDVEPEINSGGPSIIDSREIWISNFGIGTPGSEFWLGPNYGGLVEYL